MLHLGHAYQKINNIFIDNAEDLNIAKPMYNLLECSNNYSMTSRSLWNYYRDVNELLLTKIMLLIIEQITIRQ